MPNDVYQHIRLTGTSSASIEDTVQSAIARASETVLSMWWMLTVGTRGRVDGGKVVR